MFINCYNDFRKLSPICFTTSDFGTYSPSVLGKGVLSVLVILVLAEFLTWLLGWVPVGYVFLYMLVVLFTYFCFAIKYYF